MWRIVRWATLGVLIAMWFRVLGGAPTLSWSGRQYPFSVPQLAHPFAGDLDMAPEQFGMMTEPIVELVEGYHKRAFVYVGNLAVLTTFDTGSFRNAIQAQFLQELESKQKARQLGAQVVSKRSRCAKQEIFGATEGMKGSYEEVVELKVTFRGSDGRSATALLTFVVLERLATPMILGCPTLDKLMFATTTDVVELRVYDIELPAVLSDSQCGGDNVAILNEAALIRPEEMREFWVPTKAGPSKQ